MSEKKQSLIILSILSLLFLAILLMIISISYTKTHKSSQSILGSDFLPLSSTAKSKLVSINLKNELGMQTFSKNVKTKDFEKARYIFQNLKSLSCSVCGNHTELCVATLQMEFSNSYVKTIYASKVPGLSSKYFLKISGDEKSYVISRHDFVSLFYNI